VIYLADQELDEVQELFMSFLVRPSARSSAPSRTVSR